MSNRPPYDPAVGLCLGLYGGPMGLAVSYEQGTPVGGGWVAKRLRGAGDLIGKEFQSKNFLAIKFTTQHDLYW